MNRVFFLLLCLMALSHSSQSQPYSVDLQPSWLVFEDGKYSPYSHRSVNAIYFNLETPLFPGSDLRIHSSRPYFVFVSGKLSGEFNGTAVLKIDSLGARHSSTQLIVGIYQKDINPRELKTAILKINGRPTEAGIAAKPSSFFKDFVIVSGLIIIIFFLVIGQINPKLASDYFSVIKIFSPREADDAQSNARLTSSNNFQFYIGCSLLLAFYLLIILFHLPDEYALPLSFQANGFWGTVGQWLRLAFVILLLFLAKIVIVFMLTRLFNMRGLARVHFFNWIRLLLIVIGGATVIVFTYYITRGQNETFFVAFLSLIIATLIGWVFIVFMKLNGKTEHSMFHLFSYICATELIPLLITIKVLFQ
ncbi:MAG TPA: DUF4271 domain-containing protein [Chryseosolibacter sp.]